MTIIYTLYHTCTCRFESSGEAWHLSTQPSGVLEAVEQHLEFLTKQLISEQVMKSGSDEKSSSPAGCVLRDTVALATVLARVASISENYSELKKCHDLISFTVEMVQNLLKLVSRKEGGERKCVCEREGGEGRERERECRIKILIDVDNDRVLDRGRVCLRVTFTFQILLQVSTSLSDNNFSLVLRSLTQCMAFIQCLVDPRRTWQKEFMKYV